MGQSDRLVQKLWSYCNVLRDDGLSYQDYLEQLTFLPFLKMSDERAKLTGEDEAVPKMEIVDCVQPRPGEVISDPACGTGGFLLAGHGYVASH
jgi:type I restriction-modification system DNA methylase subunit